LRAPIVIAADGRGSRLAAGLNLSSYASTPRRWAFGAYFSNVTRMSARGEMHIRRGVYIGVAPLPGGLTNVSVVLDGLVRLPPSRFALRRPESRTLLQSRSADDRSPRVERRRRAARSVRCRHAGVAGDGARSRSP
jgi:hypothetical protein